MYLTLIVVAIAISEVTPQTGHKTDNFCEQQNVVIACLKTEVLSIVNTSAASYGPVAGWCSVVAADIINIDQNCFASPETIYKVISKECDKKSICYFWATDDLFKLNASLCKEIETSDSQLKVVYECLPKTDTTTTGASSVSSTVPTQTTLAEAATVMDDSQALTSLQVPIECPMETSNYRDTVLVWPITSAGLMRTATCPGDTRVLPSAARRQCRDSGIWANDIDTSRCIIPSLIVTTGKEVKTEEDLANLTDSLVNVTKTEKLTLSDVNYVIATLDDIVANKIEQLGSTDVLNITQDVLQVGDSLLSAIRDQGRTDKESTKSMEVVAAVEKVSRGTAGATDSSIHVKSQSIELFIEVVDLGKEDNLDGSISIESTGGSLSFPVTNLPQENEGSELGKLVMLFYTNQSDLWNAGSNLTVGSALLSVSMLDTNQSTARRQLNTPFSFSLDHQEDEPKTYCMFWDDEKIPRWSQEGCRRVKRSDGKTICECSHLTNFAVLLDRTGELSEGPLALTVITYVGCSISIVCLFLAWLTFQCLKNLSNDRNTIHKHLVFNLMLAEIFFLVAISPYASPHKIFCSVLAGVLHFLFLCVFAWTCLEGVQLYIMLIEVFEAERSRNLYYYLAGYGIPAVVVGVSAAIQHKGYGGQQVCWLDTQSGFIWSFAGPVAAVMLTNIIMLGVAIYMMYRHAKMVANMKHKETGKLDSVRAWIKGAIVLLVLLGLTWVFGFMYVNKDTMVIAYVFTVLNSFQGLFIFTFHCLKNEKVQKEYKRYVRRAQWLPTCIRVSYGEHKGLTNVPSHSSSSSGHLSKYFSRRRKSSSDLTSGSVRLKKQISNLTSVNSHLEETFESKEPLTGQHKISFDAGYSEEQTPLNAPTAIPGTLC
ncbi:adhesion G protein-coupled receptor L3-like isoform X2 [Watersipora subatra]|uniref:adhesion G protein-coupled receptor L3-like isoform X2 n=1 Tax=Watersipora subatra TaxID=2589382 RepID=UPI00355B702A